MPRKSKKPQVSVCDVFALCFPPEPKTKKSKKQAEEPAVYVDPPDKVKNAKGKPATLKITSWNVDGLRAWVKKNALEEFKCAKEGLCMMVDEHLALKANFEMRLLQER
uniref:DNA-(apurinic or apyrimidinic site) endonuclease n=1 Tax=Eptatretus burgeri TaxID=7764 RepID=A0A8C4NBU9_EPTBU